MAKVKFEWQGVKELQDNLTKVGLSLDDTDPAVKDILLPPCEGWADNARTLAPKRTGALRQAIYATRGGKRQRGIYMGVRKKVTVGGKRVQMFYARMVEFGTSKMAAHPYFRPALTSMAQHYVADIAPGVKKLIEAKAAEGAYHPPQ